MQKTLFLDNDFLSRAWTIGGKSYLDQLATLATRDGYTLAVTDVVLVEIGNGPNGASIQGWLNSQAVNAVNTAEFVPYLEFEQAKAAGTLPSDAKYRSQTAGLDGGDASILERMRAESRAGNLVAVASDDGFFRGVPNGGGQSIKGFGFNPTSTTLTTPDLVNQLSLRGNLTPEQRANISKLPIFDPNHANYSKALSGKLFSDQEALRMMKDGGTATTTLLSKLGSGLKFLGLAGLIYDIGTSSAEAAEAARQGDAGRASEVMAQLAARTYGGLQLGIAGGALAGAALVGTPVAVAGILIGGIAGGVLGSFTGDLLVARIWDAARQVISILNYADPDGKTGYFGQVEQDLVAAKVPVDIANKVALALNDGTLVDAYSVAARQAYLSGMTGAIAANASVPVEGEIAVRQIVFWSGNSMTTVADTNLDTTVNQDFKILEERYYGPNGLASIKTIDEWIGNIDTRYETSVYSVDGRLVSATSVTPNGRNEYYYDTATGVLALEKNYDSAGVFIPPEVVQAQRDAEERKRWESIAADRIAAAGRREEERLRAEAAKIAADQLANPPTSPNPGQPGAGGIPGSGGGGGPGVSLPLPTYPNGTTTLPSGEIIPTLPPVIVDINNIDYDDIDRQLWSGWEDVLRFLEYLNGVRSGGVPIVLDLDRSGTFDIRLYSDLHLGVGTPADGMSVPMFDFDGDGIRDRTAWVGPSDGFLVLDRGSELGPVADGLINQTQELAFAQWKTEEEWQAELAAQDPGTNIDKITDLSALRMLFDSNKDGSLDPDDEQWQSFRVWQDLNQNGIADSGELRTLDQVGIASIGLLPNTHNAVSYADGSAITGTTVAELADASQMLVGDLTLRFQPTAKLQSTSEILMGSGYAESTPGELHEGPAGEPASAIEDALVDKANLNNRIDNLVAAMAGFAPPASGQLTLPPTTTNALVPVIAANWP